MPALLPVVLWGVMMSDDSLSAAVARWIRPEIRAIQAYAVAPSAGMVKLDAMENPYRWPEPLLREWLETLREVSINRYPDPVARDLCGELRRVMGIPDELSLLLGNGSDEIIQLLALAVAAPGRVVLAPEPGFVMYRMIASLAGLRYVGVPLDADFDLDVAAMQAAMAEHDPALLFLALPNNPTGNLFSEDRVRAVIDAAPGLVVLDEAYGPFSDADHLSLVSEHPRVLLMRTLSKVGLAGLRLGLLIGAPAWLDELDKIRLPYNINVLTQASASFALRHFDVLREQTRCIRADREQLADALACLPGLVIWPSAANFLLVRVPSGRAGELFEGLKAAGILVKKLDGAHPLLADCLRFTVGTAEENARLLEAVTALLRAPAASAS